MTLIGAPHVVHEDGPGRFQSLFSWMTLIGGEWYYLVGDDGSVSILVFLDDAHRHLIPRSEMADEIRVSILVFLDDAHRRSNARRVENALSRFNPCFLG